MIAALFSNFNFHSEVYYSAYQKASDSVRYKGTKARKGAPFVQKSIRPSDCVKKGHFVPFTVSWETV